MQDFTTSASGVAETIELRKAVSGRKALEAELRAAEARIPTLEAAIPAAEALLDEHDRRVAAAKALGTSAAAELYELAKAESLTGKDGTPTAKASALAARIVAAQAIANASERAMESVRDAFRSASAAADVAKADVASLRRRIGASAGYIDTFSVLARASQGGLGGFSGGVRAVWDALTEGNDDAA